LIQNSKGKREIGNSYKSHLPYSECKDEVKEFIQDCELGIGDLIIAIARAAPETEPATDPNRVNETVQPIVNYDEGLVVVHNGAVGQRIYNELKENNIEYDYQSVIDSEAILSSYILHNRNMKDSMEYLSGGFAFLLFDEQKDRLYLVNDFKPLSWGYVRGIGLFVHSCLEPIADIVHDISGVERCGIALWEDFYYHPISGPRIQSIDLTSGFVRKEKYSPRYIIGDRWDSNNPKK
jgi:glucosamine 6-phosphate synthetase-like amidotransferase/phosphosugar isomerase protein